MGLLVSYNLGSKKNSKSNIHILPTYEQMNPKTTIVYIAARGVSFFKGT